MSPKPLRREEGVIKGPEPLQLGVLALLGGEEGRGGSEEAGLGEVLGGGTGPGAQGQRRGTDTLFQSPGLLWGPLLTAGHFTSLSSPVKRGS